MRRFKCGQPRRLVGVQCPRNERKAEHHPGAEKVCARPPRQNGHPAAWIGIRGRAHPRLLATADDFLQLKQKAATDATARFKNFDVTVNAYDYRARLQASDRFQARATPRQGARPDSFVSVEIWDQGDRSMKALEIIAPYLEDWGRHKMSVAYEVSFKNLSPSIRRLVYATGGLTLFSHSVFGTR